jgi:methionyl-tRNA formyltransferase
MTAKPRKIVFMGTPPFAAQALSALIKAGHDIVAVYTQPPRPKGRGQSLQKSAVHDLADRHGLAVFTPKSLRKSPEAVAEFLTHAADVAVVAAYGLLLPKPVLDGPKHGCLNIHASLLPRWRGAAPIQYAIWQGDAESGVTIMRMEEGLDTGPMLIKGSVPITAETTAPILHDALADTGAALILQAMDQLEDLTDEVQDDAASTYAPILKKEDGVLDFSKSADALDRQIRALNPWPGTYVMLQNGARLKVIAATLAQVSGAPLGRSGTLLDKHGHVACGNGTALKLVTVQPENAKAMDFASALNGKYLAVGQVL